MTKIELLKAFIKERIKWENTIGSLSDVQFLILVNQKGWTIKDVVSHVSWFELEMAQLIKTMSLNGSDFWLLPTDERNQAIYNKHKNNAVSVVRKTACSMTETLTVLFESLSDEDLLNASNFQNMPSEWVPWQIIAENTFGHYPEHIKSIKLALNIISE